ncbi:MAG: type I-E CRISPR-associated protein Cas6/Cse3/CasE, partial [Lactobacillus iners]|nr:type I-E CRISPR-associated protein Cas6/Cse3/CasE [Lactobacillus iners]
MYLSRVEIDLYNRKKIRELKHIGCYHGWIEDAFPDERDKPKSARSRKLWRIDNINDKCYLLILSESKPDFKKLEKYGIQHSACTKNYDEFLNSLKEGMRAKFRIKLNTVKSYS